MSSALLIVLVFGAGTDYALLLVSRYREELHHHERPIDAMLAALRGAAQAILASAATVTAGLLCLLAADIEQRQRMLGPVGAAGILSALLDPVLTLPPGPAGGARAPGLLAVGAGTRDYGAQTPFLGGLASAS